MPHIELCKNVFDCTVCHTHCDGISKGVYRFENDTAFSEVFEKMVINKINSSSCYRAAKCEEAGYPDIVVCEQDGSIHHYLEVKVQQRTFMAVQKYLPQAALFPSETVALNLSDLLRYFSIQDQTGIPVSLLWVLLRRPCLVQDGMCAYFFQTVDRLRKIYQQFGSKRRFRRKSGSGDVVSGEHKGVTVNYHFSLNELKYWHTAHYTEQLGMYNR